MRRYSISYFFGQAFKGMWRNGMMTLASITVLLSCLIVMGCFGMLVINIDKNLDSLGELNEIVAFVDADAPHEEGDKATLAPAISANGSLLDGWIDMSGREFLGWSTDPDAKEPKYSPDSEYTIDPADALSGTVTMYAVWSGEPEYKGVRIKYDTCGMSIDGELPKSDTVYKNAEKLAVETELAAKNSTVEFLGWAFTPCAEEAEITVGEELTVDTEKAKGGIITLYAVWNEYPKFATYNIVYDSNGASVDKMPTDYDVRLNAVKVKLDRLDNIAENGIEFVSKEETLQKEIENLKDYPSLVATLQNGENPYPDTFIIRYDENSEVSALVYKLQDIDGIYKTRSRVDIAENIEGLQNGVVLVFSWFVIILFLVSIFVILNTIRLVLNSRSADITVMRYIGATKWFIALPFQLEGVFIGIIAGILSFFAQWYMYSYVQKMIVAEVKMISVIPFSEIRVLLFFCCIIFGALIGLLGSSLSIRKNLKV